MKVLDFLQDKLNYILAQVVVLILMLSLVLLLLPSQRLFVGILTSIMVFAGSAVPLLLEFQRKNRFYKTVLSLYDKLDQKNLLAEVIPQPNFPEGMVLYDLLRLSNKACLDEINKYRFKQEAYREYIELWVHEIKTPIASSKLITLNNPGDVIGSLAEEMEKIEGFVEQALYYSRISTVEKDYLIRKIKLQDVCHGLLRQNASLFMRRKFTIVTDNLDQIVYCDAKWLAYIINQIIGNALKYSAAEDARISLDALRQENGVTLRINDNGIGIPANDLPRIFDKGFTGSNGRKNEKSTGMGLYICKQLCIKLGLEIFAESESGVGTTISICFPTNSMVEDIT